MQLAMAYLQVGAINQAGQLSQKLLQTGHKTAMVYYIDGAARESSGDIQGATADFEQASTLDPTNLGVLAQLTDIYIKTRRFPDAERIAKRAIAFNKTEPQAYLSLGSVYGNEAHYDDARAQFEQAATLEPKSVDPLVDIVNTYAAQKNFPMALTTVERALVVDPTDVQVLVLKADLYAQEHDDAHVAQAYDDAVVAAPNDDMKVSILARKAAYYIGQKNLGTAVQILQQAIATYPKSPAAYNEYGTYLAGQKQQSQAEQQWQTSLGLDKDYAPALMNMAQSKFMSGRYNDAITYLKHYTDVSPDAQGYALLGQAYSFVHDYQRSRDACFRSFQIQKTPDTLGCIGGADLELKSYKEGAEVFDILAANAPQYFSQNPEMLYVAGKTWEGAGQRSKAATAYKKLLPLTKKGSKQYKQLASSIAALSKPLPRAKKKK